MKKNELFTIEITGMTAEGNGVGRTEDGMAVFVPLTAVGDVISCKIVKVTKSFAYGIIADIITPSPDRAESGCPVSAKCGGCTFRHMSYSAELSVKDKLVRDAFLRLGGFDNIPFEDICGGDEDFYRNKAQYPVAEQDGRLICGFYSKRSHRVVPFTDCRLQPKIFGDITRECLGLASEKKVPAYSEESGSGVLRHIYIRRGYHSGEIMVCFVVKDKSRLKAFTDIAQRLSDRFADIKSVVLNINPKNTNVIMGTENITLFGSGEITDILCGKKITLSPMSFYQVNTAQAERLYRQGMEYAGLTGSETVLDLYCGAGTIGLAFSDRAGKIIGCEIVPEAIENAKRNAELNGVKNAEFYCGDSGELSKKLADKGIVPDVAVIDPPRKGCDKLTLDSLVRMSPKRIVMISCNPATAARDAKYLAENGYEIKKARAFDLFPRTGHVETVVLLSKGEIESKKVRVEFSLENMDMSDFQKGATYGQIKTYVKEQTGLSVSSLYIAQVKQKCGIIERENHNKAKSDGAKQPKCPPDKEMIFMLTAFDGTSSEKLVSRFDDAYRKIILENDKNTSVNQLVNALASNNISYIFSLGQKPVMMDKIYIELAGRIGDTLYKTDFDTYRLAAVLSRHGFPVRVSSNAGTSFCNHIYACGLKHISEKHYDAKMVFIHVPFEKNISDFEDYSRRLIGALNDFCM